MWGVRAEAIVTAMHEIAVKLVDRTIKITIDRHTPSLWSDWKPNLAMLSVIRDPNII
jgi:pheromone shutdown protein TraB